MILIFFFDALAVRFCQHFGVDMVELPQNGERSSKNWFKNGHEMGICSALQPTEQLAGFKGSLLETQPYTRQSSIFKRSILQLDLFLWNRSCRLALWRDICFVLQRFWSSFGGFLMFVEFPAPPQLFRFGLSNTQSPPESANPRLSTPCLGRLEASLLQVINNKCRPTKHKNSTFWQGGIPIMSSDA